MTDDRKRYTNRIAEVTWTDSATADGWDDEIIEAAYEVYSVGYIIKEDDRQIVISQAISLTHNPFCNQTVIPKIAVTKIRDLRNRK